LNIISFENSTQTLESPISAAWIIAVEGSIFEFTKISPHNSKLSIFLPNLNASFLEIVLVTYVLIFSYFKSKEKNLELV